jgi:hypothetical protein
MIQKMENKFDFYKKNYIKLLTFIEIQEISSLN